MPITRTCRISWSEFTISDQEIAILEKLSPVIGDKKISIPLPTLSPQERERRRFQWRNYFNLSKWVCTKTGAPIISTFPKGSQYIVYSQSEWWKKEWDPMAAWEDIDPARGVSDQYYSIIRRIPHPALDNAYLDQENCDFINGNGKAKDCYLISNANTVEKCLYGYFLFNSSGITNANYVRFSENCSHSTHIWKCYNVHYAFDTSETRDSRYVFSVIGGSYLLGCVGVHNATYQILNQSCSQKDYESTLEKLKYDETFTRAFEIKFQELICSVWISDTILSGSTDSSGDFCYDSKNAHHCYACGEIVDSAYISDSFNVQDSMDISQWGENTTLAYDSWVIGQNVSRIYFSSNIWWGSHDIYYSVKCMGCSYLWGCSNLTNATYCIYNKQYSKVDWEREVLALIERMRSTKEWGEFLDSKYALYPYDVSFAMMKFPLTKSEALARWLTWIDYSDTIEWVTRTIPAEKLPFDIREIPDDVLNWAIKCRITGKPYKIQPMELQFYRKFSLPLPKLHPMERVKQLFEWDKRNFSFDF